MPFRYLTDPLFLVCFGLYWINFGLELLGFSIPLLRAYLNDVVCIPFWIPIMLWAQKRLGVRDHDRPPEALEVVIPLVMWAAFFEVVIPAWRGLGIPAVPDPNDVLCYSVGALVAVVFWNWYYRGGVGPVPGPTNKRENRSPIEGRNIRNSCSA